MLYSKHHQLSLLVIMTAILVILSVGFSSAQSTTADCPHDAFLDVNTSSLQSGYPAAQLNITCDNDFLNIQSNGIITYEFIAMTPGDIEAQNYNWHIPLYPEFATQTSEIPLLGPVGVIVNGLPIFGPNEAPVADYGDPYLDGLLDYCGGHTAQGMYHYHFRPDCLFTQVDGQVGLIMGYAFDGFPILAPYICEDAACTSTKKVESSWQEVQNVTNAWEAHQYVAGSGDLDQCNGMMMSDGSYAYFATDSFPYFLGCYIGVAQLNGNTMQGGQMQGNGQMPPSQGSNGQMPPPPQSGNGQMPPPLQSGNGQMPPHPQGGSNGQMPPPPQGSNGQKPPPPQGGG